MTNIFDGLPSSIRVGPFDIPVTIKDKINENNVSGLYTHGVSIELRLDQHNAAFALDTVLHEIGHGIYNTFGLGKKSTEESVVVALAAGWAMVYRDNPMLLAWIYRMLPPK